MRYSLTSTALFPALLFATYTLSGFAQVPRTVPVTVQNLPAVQAVKEVTNPALQPMQFSDGSFTDIVGDRVVLSTGLRANAVPTGKRLVVQHLFYRIMSRDIEGDPSCHARVLEDDREILTYPLPIRVSAVTSTGTEVAAISQAMTFYAEPGQEVGVFCSIFVGADVLQDIGIVGYYIDID